MQLLKAVRQRERLGVEDGDLLLDGDGEIGRLLELLFGEGELLLGVEALRVSHPTTLVKGTQQPFGDAAPAPAVHGGRASGAGQAGTLCRIEPQEALELDAEVGNIARREARQIAR